MIKDIDTCTEYTYNHVARMLCHIPTMSEAVKNLQATFYVESLILGLCLSVVKNSDSYICEKKKYAIRAII